MNCGETMRDDLSRIAVVIPALNPDEKLVALVESLAQYPFAAMVVVNDGSDAECDAVFDRLRSFSRVHLLRHTANRGNGRAQKTAFEYVLSDLPEVIGVITADADGQHAAADVVRVGELLARSDGHPVLGVRTLAAGVPWRSKIGNGVTRYVFKFLSGCAVRDTQCGLRGFPTECLEELVTARGERFEYISSVLTHLCARDKQPVETPVSTIYLDRNRSSHFRPFADSARIYSLLFASYALSIAAVCTNLAAFTVILLTTGSVTGAIAAGRLLLLIGFAIDRGFAIQPYLPSRKSVSGYALALALTGAVSCAAIWSLHRYLGWNALVAGIAMETTLMLAILARR